MKKKAKCKLTPAADRYWQKSFENHANTQGINVSKADKLAFKDLIKKFPKYKGCKHIQ